MLGLIARRIAWAIAVVAIAVTAMFFLIHAAADDPVDALGPGVASTPAARAAIEHRLGLDRPLLAQYADYMGGLARGDLGTSLADGSSVGTQIADAAPVSLELGAIAALGAFTLALGLGSAAALRRGRASDGAVRVGSVVALSVPPYWLAIVALALASEYSPALTAGTDGFVRFLDDPLRNLQVLVLPATILGLGTFGLMARTLRASLVDVLANDDVRFARAMGMREVDVLRRIALPSALGPTLAVAGIALGGLVSGTVLIENVFQLPGLGQLMVNAFTRRDYPLALGATVVTASIFCALNLTVDVLACVVDPRTRRRAQARA